MSVAIKSIDPKPSQTSVDSISARPLETGPLCVPEFTERGSRCLGRIRQQTSHGSPFHLWRGAEYRRDFRLSTQYRLAIEGAHIRGVLPMFL